MPTAHPSAAQGLEAFGDIHQHDVAAGPPQRVVDVTEAVDVQQSEGGSFGAAHRYHLLEPFEEHAPIGKTGQWVRRRELADRRDVARQRRTERRVERSAKIQAQDASAAPAGSANSPAANSSHAATPGRAPN